MYDRPDIFQLLDAVKVYLQNEVVPALKEDRKRYYQALVAVNLIGVVAREIHMRADHLYAEWDRLNFVQDVAAPVPPDVNEARAALAERNRTFCEEIKAGRYDIAPGRSALFEHLLITAHTQLEVSSPKFLEALAIEDAKRAL